MCGTLVLLFYGRCVSCMYNVLYISVSGGVKVAGLKSSSKTDKRMKKEYINTGALNGRKHSGKV